MKPLLSRFKRVVPGEATWFSVAHAVHGGFACTLLGLMLSGCATSGADPYFAGQRSQANVYVAPERSNIAKIAILPFKGPTELIGSSVSDLVVTEILRTRRYTLVERGQMASVLGEAELAMAGLSQSKAVEVGRMMGADGVVIGTVDEYTMQAQGGKTYAVVGVAVRLIHCASGQIVWSADLARVADSPNVPLAAHARAVVHELMCGLYQNWMRQPKLPAQRAGQAATTPPQPSAPPVAPTDLKSSDMGLRAVELSWNPLATTAHKLRIERASSPEGPFARVAEVRPDKGSFTDDRGLQDATTYYYRIVGLNSEGATGNLSRVVESMTAPPPTPPTQLKAEAPSSRCVALTWTPPRAEGVASYRIERAAEDEPPVWQPRGETRQEQFTDGGRAGCDLTDSTVYRYRVIAVNRVGAVGEPSAPVRITTLPPPAAVEGIVATPRQVRCVPLAWSAGSEPDIAGYEIERATTAEGPFEALATIRDAATLSYLDGRRDPGVLADETAYWYRIRAFNRVGAHGHWSKVVSATTRAVPVAPVGLKAVDGLPRAVEVVWSASDDEKVIGYDVARTEAGTDAWSDIGWVEVRETTHLLDRAGARESAPTGRLKDGTAYDYRVRAVNTAKARSPWSETVQATTKPAPKAPAVPASTDDLPGKVELKWEANAEPDIVAYVVEARAADGSRWREITRVTACKAEETGLKPGQARRYRIKAIDAHTHESAWSEEVPGAARPLPPVAGTLQAEVDGEVATLTWEPPDAEITEYRVYQKKLLGASCIATVTDPVAIIGAAKLGRRASLYVTVIDEAGLESPPSVPCDVQFPK
ncbi:MAG: fibronectin type III domain-containing protein [Kiritimatiellia bacterium]|jgi:fibronectin type 3 domain-containing protein/TolB-like protein